MPRFSHFVTALGIVAAVAVGAVLLNPVPAQTQQRGAPVIITQPLPVPITAAEPLPVTGTVNAGPITIANPANDPVLVRDVNEPSTEPFQFGVSGNWAEMEGGTTIVTVPNGKRLVIEFASAWVAMYDQTVGVQAAYLHLGNLNSVARLPCAYLGGQGTCYTCATTMKYYAGPEETVRFKIYPGDGISGGSFHVFISGYLLPAPVIVK